jgi:hypothetical protein
MKALNVAATLSGRSRRGLLHHVSILFYHLGAERAAAVGAAEAMGIGISVSKAFK